MAQNKRIDILEAIDHKIKICKDANFTGTLTIEIEINDGGIRDKYIQIKEKLN